ncbi:MAG: phosphoribosyltransferase domain-containing protein, partial [Candidatus Melainabacteria bacterium]|nr:phosphoribosyltransferase domain-containing protein [Candidatus Melainabacteria bacterium]
MFQADKLDAGRHNYVGAGKLLIDGSYVEESHTVELPTGTLDIKVFHSEMPLDEICGFAARQNPKRGFLFVSKVLGKHIPVRPSMVREVHTRLAAQIPADLPGPVVVIGMAETAICLGNGVFDEYARLTGRKDVMFTQSTRYRLDRPVAIEFLEEHSHAADHIIYEPEHPGLKEMFFNARSLVLIDDEASTGKTFVNLVKNMISIMPHVEHVVTGVITDWRGPKRTKETLAAIPVPASTIAILHGEYQFTPSPTLKLVEMPKVT